jgi:hypothetical protein
VAVAGAAMEPEPRIGLHEFGREAGCPDRDKAGRPMDLSGSSDLVNCKQAGTVVEFAISR